MRQRAQAESTLSFFLSSHLHVFFLNFWKDCHTENNPATYVLGLRFLIITNQIPAISPLVKHMCTHLPKYFFTPQFIKYFRLKQIPCTKLITNHRRYLSSQAFYRKIVRFNHLSHIFTIYWASFIIHSKILTTASYFNYHFWLWIKNKTTPRGTGEGGMFLSLSKQTISYYHFHQ